MQDRAYQEVARYIPEERVRELGRMQVRIALRVLARHTTSQQLSQLERNLAVPRYYALMEAAYRSARGLIAFHALCCGDPERIAEQPRVIQQLGDKDPYLFPVAIRAGFPASPFMLSSAVRGGFVDLVIQLAEMGIPVDGSLVEAVLQRDRTMVDTLLALGADPNFVIGELDCPLAVALQQEDRHLAEVLILRGADAQACRPLTLALLPTERLEWFLDNTSYALNIPGEEGTLLYHASKLQDATKVEMLLRRGAAPEMIPNPWT